MEKSKKLKFLSQYKQAASVFFSILCLLMLTLTVFLVIGTKNKAKEGKYIGQDIETRNVITVSDTGKAYARPDLALSTFSVITEGETVAEAMSENTSKMNAIIGAMKNEGVKDKDLKTVGFNVYPRYEWIREEIEKYPHYEEKRVLVGYEVRQSLQVKMRSMEGVGHMIEKAAEAGANQVGELHFTIDDEEGLKKQARKEAIKKAKDKAKELARELGVSLVQIAGFRESSSYPNRYYDYARDAGYAESSAMPAPAIEAGESTVEVSVTITYVID